MNNEIEYCINCGQSLDPYEIGYEICDSCFSKFHDLITDNKIPLKKSTEIFDNWKIDRVNVKLLEFTKQEIKYMKQKK